MRSDKGLPAGRPEEPNVRSYERNCVRDPRMLDMTEQWVIAKESNKWGLVLVQEGNCAVVGKAEGTEPCTSFDMRHGAKNLQFVLLG